MLVLYVLISCLSFISLLIVSASMDQTQKVVTVKAEIATSAVKLKLTVERYTSLCKTIYYINAVKAVMIMRCFKYT